MVGFFYDAEFARPRGRALKRTRLQTEKGIERFGDDL